VITRETRGVETRVITRETRGVETREWGKEGCCLLYRERGYLYASVQVLRGVVLAKTLREGEGEG